VDVVKTGFFSFGFQVHFCYGDELGLTSDDEDYIDPYEGKGEIESLILEGIILEVRKCQLTTISVEGNVKPRKNS
jgi:hypothetical protein